MSSSSLDTFGLSADNTLLKRLKEEKRQQAESASRDVDLDSSKGQQQQQHQQFLPRQVKDAHYIHVQPEPVPAPSFVIASESCAKTLGIDVKDIDSDKFVQAFSGNTLLPGLDKPYCTVYGCHVYGSWMGPLGDGRAMALGEVLSPTTGERFELQLKGCGRSAFSRGFDGRAVLRSCVREFLASEAMHHLGVETTRALSIIETGEQVRRAWYVGATSDALESKTYTGRMARPSGGAFPPDRMHIERGAVMCRVSKSFLRVAQFEIFAQREELDNLQLMADYVCEREFPHLLEIAGPRRYIELFRSVCRATAQLVADWLRVGYVQGNMNSDNILLGGRTLDYGPFAFVEKFDPLYQPFTSDQQGKFAFMRQPSAMAVNILTLAASFQVLLEHASTSSSSGSGGGGQSEPLPALLEELQKIAQAEFPDLFHSAFSLSRARKLGLSTFKESDNLLWRDLEMLMYKQGAPRSDADEASSGGVDFTIFFRELCSVAAEHTSVTAGEALSIIEPSFYLPVSSSGASSSAAAAASVDIAGWTEWLDRYLNRLADDDRDLTRKKSASSASSASGAASPAADFDRAETMRLANPKYIMRNWMAIKAYEAAERGDHAVLEELHALLERPYDEQGPSSDERWYRKAPAYARNMPGALFLS